MIQYIFSPRWFYGIDIIFEAFSLIIVFLIARYGYKLYRVSNNKKHKYFSIFFFLIGVAFLFKILSNFDIYYVHKSTVQIANTIFYFTTSHISEILFTIGFSVFKFLTLLSFFGLLYLTWKKNNEIFWLGLYFLIIVTIFSHSAYYIFHITMVVMLFFLFTRYYKNYKNSPAPSKSSLLIALSFFIVFLSQVAFTTIPFTIIMYVVGEILQLMGYMLLLYDYILVTKNER